MPVDDTVSGSRPFIEPSLLPHFTAAEYERLGDGGAFGERKVELLEGIVYELPPKQRPQATFISRANTVLVLALGERYAVRVQCPLWVKEHDSIPEPDFAVMTRAAEEAADHKPFTADLIIEVSDSSLQLDRLVRQRIYARARIPEYVIANVKQRQLEVFTVPDPTRSEYRHTRLVSLDEVWRSKRLPKITLKPRELFIPYRK